MLVTPQQSNPGDEITAAAINNPINQIAAVVNGQLSNTNISAGGISTSNIADASVTGAKMDGTYKVNRNNNSSNTIESSAKLQSGWVAGTITATTQKYTFAVVFPVAYTNPPIVVATSGGDQFSGAIALGSGGDAVIGGITAKAINITNTGCNIVIWVTDSGSWATGQLVYAQYISLGA